MLSITDVISANAVIVAALIGVVVTQGVTIFLKVSSWLYNNWIRRQQLGYKRVYFQLLLENAIKWAGSAEKSFNESLQQYTGTNHTFLEVRLKATNNIKKIASQLDHEEYTVAFLAKYGKSVAPVFALGVDYINSLATQIERIEEWNTNRQGFTDAAVAVEEATIKCETFIVDFFMRQHSNSAKPANEQKHIEFEKELISQFKWRDAKEDRIPSVQFYDEYLLPVNQMILTKFPNDSEALTLREHITFTRNKVKRYKEKLEKAKATYESTAQFMANAAKQLSFVQSTLNAKRKDRKRVLQSFNPNA